MDGPGIQASSLQPSIEGDLKNNMNEILKGSQILTFVDVTAVQNSEGTITVSMTNRSFDKTQTVKLLLPPKYIPTQNGN